jgi:hypothetical protein
MMSPVIIDGQSQSKVEILREFVFPDGMSIQFLSVQLKLASDASTRLPSFESF